MSNTEVEKSPPSRGSKHICVPFETEAQYQECVADVAQYRAYLTTLLAQHPELFPQAMGQGYTFPDCYRSRKQGAGLRRIKLKASKAVFTLRPSFVLPYLSARTGEVEKALFLRQWGVPFEALAYVFGRDAMFWYRTWLRFGRPNLVGTTVKRADRMPQDLVADEKITWLAGEEVVVPTTVGGACVVGIRVATEATSQSLQEAYGEFVAETRAIFPAYQARAVCTDGFQATREAWHRLWPHLTLVLGFLHSLLKIPERCRGVLRRHVLDRAWRVYQGATKAQFSQRRRRLAEWARTTLDGTVAEMVGKRAHHRADFTPAYDCPAAARTTNAVDRLHNHLERSL
ncbi:MAG TPA: hypothetical protein VGX03_15270 [Candidatus Binatia bacterium]|jgi:hypothetical protein|nr:hypothetical protein [Candidatus Binatia bacterium]